MAILTDLPNELLLSIIADVSPVYIDYFLLTCKRIYGLRADVIRAQDLVRSSFLSQYSGSGPDHLLRIFFEDPKLALNLLSWKIGTKQPCHDRRNLENLDAEIEVQVSQNPYTAPLELKHCEYYLTNAGDLVIPLLITRLQNLRKLHINVLQPRFEYLLETVLQIVEVSHDPAFDLQQPLAFGRLTEAHINASSPSINGIELGALLAMIPSLRKLYVTCWSREEYFFCAYPRHPSGVTEMFLEYHVHLSYIEELVGRTHALRRFTCNHVIMNDSAKLLPRLLNELLKQHTRQSLSYLRLLSRAWSADTACPDLKRNYNDLSIGSLREFPTLKTLITGVDMFIKTRGHSEDENGHGTIQRLISWLPASLETLVLQQGLEEWDRDVLRMLFRGFRNNKRARLPNLRLIHLLECPNLDQAMPDDLKTACQETGVKISHAAHECLNDDCDLVARQLEKWEDLPWIVALENCCVQKLDPPYDYWAI